MSVVKKLFLILVIVVIFCAPRPASAQDTRWFVSGFGGINSVFKYGCVCDYELGVNDFPQTPAHTTGSFGLSVGYLLTGGLGIELDGRYHSNTQLTLSDPSDGDRVTLDSSKHYSLTANLIYQFLGSKFRPYLLAGAGFDTLTGVDEQTLTTEYGYTVTFYPPEKKTDFMANFGAGLIYYAFGSVGLRLDARYVYIPGTDDHAAISSLNATAGLTLRF
jgi:outer membrane protein W